MDNKSTQHGGCVCGAFRFHTLNAPQRITICHCLWCQRRTGTAFGTELVYLQSDLVFSKSVSASSYMHQSDVSGRWLKAFFCPRCGTNLGLTLEAVPDIRSIPAGVFDEPGWINTSETPTRHAFTRTKRDWGVVSDNVEVHEEYFR